MSVVDSKSLEIWVQSGIPEDGELVFNVHVRNLATHEWEVSNSFLYSIFIFNYFN